MVALCLMAAPGARAITPENKDPHEKLNRKVMKLNDAIDTVLLRPVAKTYIFCTPHFARTGVRNFFDNLTEPNTFINNLLQGKLKQSGKTVSRFAINTTIGVVGIFDVAKHWKLERHEQDIGVTFGVWGMGEGNYHVLPILGPSTTRDDTWQVIQVILGVTSFPVSMLDMASQRAQAEDDLQAMNKLAVDRYVFLREAYRQHRNFMIHGGQAMPAMSQLMLDDDGADEPTAAANGGEKNKIAKSTAAATPANAAAPESAPAGTVNAPAAHARTVESAMRGKSGHRPALPQRFELPKQK